MAESATSPTPQVTFCVHGVTPHSRGNSRTLRAVRGDKRGRAGKGSTKEACERLPTTGENNVQRRPEPRSQADDSKLARSTTTTTPRTSSVRAEERTRHADRRPRGNCRTQGGLRTQNGDSVGERPGDRNARRRRRRQDGPKRPLQREKIKRSGDPWNAGFAVDQARRRRDCLEAEPESQQRSATTTRNGVQPGTRRGNNRRRHRVPKQGPEQPCGKTRRSRADTRRGSRKSRRGQEPTHPHAARPRRRKPGGARAAVNWWKGEPHQPRPKRHEEGEHDGKHLAVDHDHVGKPQERGQGDPNTARQSLRTNHAATLARARTPPDGRRMNGRKRTGRAPRQRSRPGATVPFDGTIVHTEPGAATHTETRLPNSEDRGSRPDGRRRERICEAHVRRHSTRHRRAPKR